MNEEIRDLLATNPETLDSYRVWAQRCDSLVQLLRGKCRNGSQRMSVGTVNATIIVIIRLEIARQALRRRFERTGAGDSSGGGVVEGVSSDLTWLTIETAFRDRVSTGVVLNTAHIEPKRFLEDARNTVLAQVRSNLERHICLKVNTVFNGEFVANLNTATKAIVTKNHQITLSSNLREWFDVHVVDKILTALEEFQERDSGWALSRILSLTVNVNKCNPMRAGCWIQVPRELNSKRALINVRSSDQACFAWAVVAALFPVKNNPGRVSQYPHYSTVLNLEGIHFPVSLRQIARFERLNDISINVFTLRDNNRVSVVPLRLTEDKRNRHVNLLYLPEQQQQSLDVPPLGHFVWIKNLSRLVGSQLSRKRVKKYICDRCLHYFDTNEKLHLHSVDCGRINDCAIVLPSEDDKWLHFRHEYRKERLPFVVYADLECVLSKDDRLEGASRNIYSYQHHKAFSVGYYLRSTIDEINSAYRFHRGEDCVSWFVDELNILAHRAKTVLSRNVPMVELTPDEWRVFQASTTRCYICGRLFELGDTRVRDHCHITGRYRGPAHSRCNLIYRQSYVIPIFFHNLSGYDAHFIIKDVANRFEGNVELLPLTKENYISFTKNVKDTLSETGRDYSVKLRFVDSFKFLGASLEKLVSYLDKDKLAIARTEFSDLVTEDFELLTRKGVFPYEYVDIPDKLFDTELPPREAFMSSLTGEVASDSDYEHAVKVWRRFAVANLGEYSDLYLKTDVLLLADVFENFRDTCIASYDLDPAHYYTLPGFTWDAMLKFTSVRLELLTDIDMVLFVERGIRGGLSQCSHRYARANNKYISQQQQEQSTYLMYYDINNMYGWAMCEALPYAEFKWVEKCETFDLLSVERDSAIGYILEVDLAYPRDLHDPHADLPFCPMRGKPPGKRSDKLLATVYDKTRYVAHYRILQQCVQHGLRVIKIHRVLQFAQSRWLRGYIELNTEFRTRASNEFEKNLFKLMNNAVFGKTMENVREHVDVRLVTRWDGRFGAEDMISKPNFHSRSIFSEDLIAVELRKLEVKFNKPIYVGMSILDVSKTLLYEFHYDYMRPLYGEKCKLLYTDTDSLVYLIECEDVYDNMRRDIARFDTSEYPENNVYGMPRANKKIPGLMKDENNGLIMTEFIGLRAKMYALRVTGKSDTKRVKGIRTNIVSRNISFEDYVRCLNESLELSRRQSRIRSTLHEVYTVSELKLALSPHDDKRYVIPNSFDTLPWGHNRVPSL